MALAEVILTHELATVFELLVVQAQFLETQHALSWKKGNQFRRSITQFICTMGFLMRSKNRSRQ